MARILVVDDEDDMLVVLKILLSAEGHVVHTAHNGTRALQIAFGTPPHLVMTDWMMPELDGLGLCHQLRSDDRTRLVPIVVHSASGNIPDGQGTVYDAFVRKPFEFDQLLEVIRRLL